MPLRLCYPRSLSVTIISFDICDITVHRLPISKKSASIANNKTEKKCEKGTALKLKTFKMYHRARKSFQGTIMSETLWGAQPLFSFQVEEEELFSACGKKINFITLRKILRSDGNVTQSLNPWLTHSPLLLKNSNMWILHPQCSTSVWSPGDNVKETWLHLRAKVCWRKENPLLAKYFIRRWKQIILRKLRTFFNFVLNGLTLVPGTATITRVQAPPLVVCKMIITIACITCSLFSDHTFCQIHF